MNTPQQTPTRVDVAIVGAGLCGLALADRLAAHGLETVLLEARNRPGGRVLSETAAGTPVDLGPAWIWPHNHRMRALLERLGLATFPQRAEGNLVFQDQAGRVRRDLTMATMAGSLRVAGGLGRVTEKLAEALPERVLRLDHRVTAIRDGVAVRVDGPDGEIKIEAARVVLAMPPRLVAATDLSPALDPDFRAKLAAVPTWMAGHAKFLAVYDTPFWVGQGLSGDAISHRGPMAEIHDASPHPGGTGALFGFLGVPAAMRLAHAEALPAACLAQLVALFGPAAGEPRATVYRDWADDPFTATAADHAVPAGHPAYGLPSSDAVQWDGRLILSGTETAGAEGGFLEGALEAAETASALILEG